MRRIGLWAIAALALTACHHPEVEVVDFDTFHVISVQTSDVFLQDGSLNPEISVMENPEMDEEEPQTKLAYTNANAMSTTERAVLSTCM